MALVVYDRVQETTATTGTGSVILGGAVASYQSFAVVGNGNLVYYTILNGNAWEVGIGTYSTTGPTLARTTVLSNSNGNTSPISLSGSSFVWCDYPSEKAVYYDNNGTLTIGSTLGYSDTGIIASFASTVAGYNQVIFQNRSTATNASSNLNVSNDAATATAGYAEFGINSSTFTGSGSFNLAGASYLASASTDLAIGTYGAYNIHFVTNSNTTDAMTIFNDGGASLGGLGDPGIGNVAVNNAVVGFTAITSSATAVSLLASSTQVQAVVGSVAQRINLPQATTLLKGTFYTISNASSANVTVYDNAGTLLETITPGGAAQFLCTSNATSAGAFGIRVFAASNVQWGNTALNYTGNITGATWNGVTIGTGYGGTGLTVFSSGTNALYSTSTTNLTSGTLPPAAGGTGVTTTPSNGQLLIGNGSNYTVATLGTSTGISTTTGSGTLTINNTGVTSITFGSTGLTPSTTTSGAVTVGGILGATYGGTGINNGTNTLTLAGNVSHAGAFTQTFTATGNTSLTLPTSGTLLTTTGSGSSLTFGTGSLSLAGNLTTSGAFATTLTTTGTTTLTLPTSGTLLTTTGSGSSLTFGTGTLSLAGNVTHAGSFTQTFTATGNTSVTLPTSGTLLTTTGSGSSLTFGTGSLSLAGNLTFSGAFATTFTVSGSTSLTLPTSGTLLTTTGSGSSLTGIVTSNVAGTGISVSGSTGAVTITNAGVTSFTSSSGLSTNTSATGAVSVTNTGVTSAVAGTGISVSGSTGAVTITNSGVTALTGTTNQITVSASTGSVTLSTPQAIGTASSVQFGSFGVGTAASGTTGEIRATNNITAYYSSDRKFKKNIQPIPNALDSVMAIGGKLYDWTDEYLNARGGADGYFYQKQDFGMIAQDVEKSFPRAVRKRPDGSLALDYEKMCALAFQAIIELKAEIELLKAK